MTLADFITSVCKEVLEEENVCNNGYKNKEDKPKYLNSVGSKKSNLITEAKLKSMIGDGSVSNITEKNMFTPLARDIFREYKKNRK